ncbi:MAG: tetratricopeptide repeat protein, partial [Verrucomicrobiota bacterium]
HGVAGFTEVDPGSGQVVPVSYATRRCQTLWEILGRRGLRSHVASWFATQGEQDLNGKMVSNLFCHLQGVKQGQPPATWPEPPPGTYWPPGLAAEMNDLRVSPFEVDPDQILRLFVPDAPKINFEKDSRLWLLARQLAEAFTTHSAATYLMESDPGWDFMAIYYRAIDEISHAFMPYHPPKMEGIAGEDFEMYKEVVAGAYRLHDLFLQRLIHLAGPDATVMLVSDHGFHSDHLRPKFTPGVPAGITIWHRPQGIFAARGPGLKRDELVFGAQLLDVTPTILHHFGLPIGDDMEGRVLEEAFTECTAPARIPTWEEPGGIRRERRLAGDADSRAILDQFVALGYIEEISGDRDQAAAETNRENEWNMARAWMYGGHFDRALPLLENCFHAQPGRTDYAQLLAACQLQLGLLEEADASASKAMETLGNHDVARLLQASIAIQKENHAEALPLIESVRESNPNDPQMLLMLAQCQVQLRRWDDAEDTLRKLLAADPQNPQAHITRARQQLHLKNAEGAAESAIEAIGLQYGSPHAHFLLGAALVQLQRWNEAERPLLNCLRIEPKFLRAYRLLSRVYRALGDQEKKAACELRYRGMFNLSARNQTVHVDTLRKDSARRRELRAAAARQSPAGETSPQSAEPSGPPMEFVIVSGLPRSGTS